jgi:hypothetical protein
VDYALGEFGDWFVPEAARRRFTTPGGTLVVTHHREVANNRGDISR